MATKRGLSLEQVCLIVAQDRHQQALAEVIAMGMPSATDVRQVLAPMVHKEAILCTDGAKPYRRYCQEAEIQHVPVDSKKRLRGALYYLNNVNNRHKRFRAWHNVDLHGVATKYLPNCTTWFIFLDGSSIRSGCESLTAGFNRSHANLLEKISPHMFPQRLGG